MNTFEAKTKLDYIKDSCDLTEAQMKAIDVAIKALGIDLTPLEINPANMVYYSEEYIRGWKDGVFAQYKADKASIRKAEI